MSAHIGEHTYESTEESTHVRAERRKTDPKTGKHMLCEPAQSRRTWTCHKSRFVEIYRNPRKMLQTTLTTSIKHRALTLTVRIPSVWPHWLGK